MWLKQVTLKDGQFGMGLKAVEMRNLGQVVALFGPNGAGKTRLLKCVEKYVQESHQAIGQAGKKLQKDYERNIERNRNRLDALNVQLQQFSSDGVVRGMSKEELTREIRGAETELRRNEEALRVHRGLRLRVVNSYSEEPSIPPVLVSLAFPSRNLRDVNEYLQSELDRSMGMVSNWSDARSFAQAVIPFLHQMARAGFNAENPNADKEELAPWLRLYEEARRIIKLLMRMEYGYVPKGADGVPGLDGRPIRIGELSEGQRMLLIYTVCLLKGLVGQFEKGKPDTVEGAIVLIDEPEVHLHPAAVIQLVESMRHIVGKSGQIWLGTHAVCLLPHLRPEEIWTVYGGEVSAAGIDGSHEAVELLVGSEESVDKLQSFLQEPAKWAAARFSAECLLAPEKSGFWPGDPQMFQVADLIKKRMGEGKGACILDCGAGRGRLGRMLRDGRKEEAGNLVTYLAVEPDTSCHDEIRQGAEDMLADCGVLLSVEGIPSKYQEKIQVAVLCNVLHEIRPTKWCHELKTILSKMARDGSIIICEDQWMPVGELPHELGYLVLGVGEIQTLFSLSERPRERRSEEKRYKERLLCVEIPATSAAVSQDSVKQAIKDLRGRLDGLIQAIRGKTGKATAKDGREYTFYCHMFVNCEFALKELG